MNNEEEEKFREYISQFSVEQLQGWLAAIMFIMPANEPIKDISVGLASKLLAVLDICADIIVEKQSQY